MDSNYNNTTNNYSGNYTNPQAYNPQAYNPGNLANQPVRGFVPPAQPYAMQPATAAQESNIFSIIGLAIGIATIVLSFFTKYSIGFGVVAMVLSIIGRTTGKSKNANATFVCSIVGLIMAVVFAAIRYYIILKITGYATSLIDNGPDMIFNYILEQIFE